MHVDNTVHNATESLLYQSVWEGCEGPFKP